VIAEVGFVFPDAPRDAVQVFAFMQAMYELTHTINTYPKPVVTVANGVAVGAGASLALSSKHKYSTETTALAFPETGIGMVPSGGASFHLSRMGKGVGMYLALTGGHLSGPAAYWSSAVGYMTSNSLLAQGLTDAGHPFSNALKHHRMEEDGKYLKIVQELQHEMSAMKHKLLFDRRPEDANEDDLERFYELNTWYRLYAAGQKHMADTFLAEGYQGIGLPDNAASRGSFLDFGEKDAVRGRAALAGSAHLEDAARHELSVAAMHDKARMTEAVPSAPTEAELAQLGAIDRVFGGHLDKGDPLQAAVQQGSAAAQQKTQLEYLESIADSAALEAGWEARLSAPLASLTEKAFAAAGGFEGAEGAPHLEAMHGAVAAGVVLSWPMGMLPPVVVDALARGHGAGNSKLAHVTLARAVAEVTADLHGIPADPLLLPAYQGEVTREGESSWRHSSDVELPTGLAANLHMEDIASDWHLEGTARHKDALVPALDVTQDVGGIRGVTADVLPSMANGPKPAWWPSQHILARTPAADSTSVFDFSAEGPVHNPAKDEAWRLWLRKRISQNKKSAREHVSVRSALNLEEEALDAMQGAVQQLGAVATLANAETGAQLAKGAQRAAETQARTGREGVSTAAFPKGLSGNVKAADAVRTHQSTTVAQAGASDMEAMLDGRSTVAKAADVHVSPMAENSFMPAVDGTTAGGVTKEVLPDGTVRFVQSSAEAQGGNVFKRGSGGKWAPVRDLDGMLDAILLKWQAAARPFADITVLGGKREAALRQMGRAELRYIGAMLPSSTDGTIAFQSKALLAPELSPEHESALDAVLQAVASKGALPQVLDYGVSGAALDAAKASNPALASDKSGTELQKWVAKIRSQPADTLEANAWASLSWRLVHLGASGDVPVAPKGTGDAAAAAKLASTEQPRMTAAEEAVGRQAVGAAVDAAGPLSLSTNALVSPLMAGEHVVGLGGVADSATARALAAAALDEAVQGVRSGVTQAAQPTTATSDPTSSMHSLAHSSVAIEKYRAASKNLQSATELHPAMTGTVDLAAYGADSTNVASLHAAVVDAAVRGSTTGLGAFMQTVVSRAASMFEAGGDAMTAAAAHSAPGDLKAGIRALADLRASAPATPPKLGAGGTDLPPLPWNVAKPAQHLHTSLQPFASMFLLQAVDAGTLGLPLAQLAPSAANKFGDTPLGQAAAAPAEIRHAAQEAGDVQRHATTPADWPRDFAVTHAKQVEDLPLVQGGEALTGESVKALYEAAPAADGEAEEGAEAGSAAISDKFAYARMSGKVTSLGSAADARAHYVAQAAQADSTAAEATATGSSAGAGVAASNVSAEAVEGFAAAAAQQALHREGVPYFVARELLTSAGAEAPQSPMLQRLAASAGVTHPTNAAVPTSAEEVAALASTLTRLGYKHAELANLAAALGTSGASAGHPGQVVDSIAALQQDIEDTRTLGVAAAMGGAVPKHLEFRQPPTPLQYAQALGLTDLLEKRYTLTDAAGNQRAVPLISEHTTWAPTAGQSFGVGSTGVDPAEHTGHGPQETDMSLPGVHAEGFSGHHRSVGEVEFDNINELGEAPLSVQLAYATGDASLKLRKAHAALDEQDAVQAMGKAAMSNPRDAGMTMEEATELLMEAAGSTAGMAPAAAMSANSAAWGNQHTLKAKYAAELAAEGERESRRRGMGSGATMNDTPALGGDADEMEEQQAVGVLGEPLAGFSVGEDHLAPSAGRDVLRGALEVPEAKLGSHLRNLAMSEALDARLQENQSSTALEASELQDHDLRGVGAAFPKGDAEEGQRAKVSAGAGGKVLTGGADARAMAGAFGELVLEDDGARLYAQGDQDVMAQAVLEAARRKYVVSADTAERVMSVLLSASGIQRAGSEQEQMPLDGSSLSDMQDAGMAGTAQDDEFSAQLTHDPEFLVAALGLPRTDFMLDTAGQVTAHFAAADAARFATVHPRSVQTVLKRLESDNSEWARTTLTRMRSVSPTAAVLTHLLLTEAARVDFNTAAAMEARAAQYMAGHPDFVAGTAAVGSSSKPQWSPATIEEVDEGALRAVLKPSAGVTELQLQEDVSAPLLAAREAAVEKWVQRWGEYMEGGTAASQLGDVFAKRFRWDYELGEHMDYAVRQPALPSVISPETPEEMADIRRDLHEFKMQQGTRTADAPTYYGDQAASKSTGPAKVVSAPADSPYIVKLTSGGLPHASSTAAVEAKQASGSSWVTASLRSMVQRLTGSGASEAEAAEAAKQLLAPHTATDGFVRDSFSGVLARVEKHDGGSVALLNNEGGQVGQEEYMPPAHGTLRTVQPSKVQPATASGQRMAAAAAADADEGIPAITTAEQSEALQRAVLNGEALRGDMATFALQAVPEDTAAVRGVPELLARETLALHADLHATAVAAGMAPADLEQYDMWMAGKQRRLASILAKDARGVALTRGEAEELIKADTYGLVALSMPKRQQGAAAGSKVAAQDNSSKRRTCIAHGK